MTDPRITTARDLLLEATTAEVVGAFAAAGVGHISLKGPVLKQTAVSRRRRACLRRRRCPREPGRLGRQPRPNSQTSGSSHCCWTSSPVTARTTPDPTLARPGGRPSTCTAPCSGPKLLRPSCGASSTGRPSLRCSATSRSDVLNPAGQLMHVALHAAQNGAGDARTLRYLDTLHRDRRRAASGRRAPDRQGDRGNRRLRARTLTRPVRAGAEPHARDHAQRFRAHGAQGSFGPEHGARDRVARDSDHVPRSCALRLPQDLPAGRLHGKLLPERPLARRPSARLPGALGVARAPAAALAPSMAAGTPE